MLCPDMQATATQRRLARFIAVGCLAAAVHWALVVTLVDRWHWHPLAANVMGWLVAFAFSFAGHHHLTFKGHGAAPGIAALRFFMVSVLGFAVNECAYALLLQWSGRRYDILLAAVLIGMAGVTYLLGRHWAFLRSPAPLP